MLIVKLAAMGDIVMASTLIGAVRDRWPDAQITWLTGDQFAPLVRRFEGVDVVRSVDAESLLAGPAFRAAHRAPHAALKRAAAIASTVRAIGRRPWDLALVAHSDERYAQLLRFAKVRDLRQFKEPRKDRYMGLEYSSMLEDAGPSSPLSPVLSPLPSPRHNPPLHLPSLTQLNKQQPARRVTLAPGGARNLLRDNPLRRWPVESWAALARELKAANCELTIIGAASDRAEADVVLAAVPDARDEVGKQDLDALLAELASSDVLVTHDSGPMHLAQLTRTPVVALFGPTSPTQFVAPGADVTVLSAAQHLPCAPCYDGKDYAVCSANLCLSRVGPEMAAGTVLAVLAGRREKGGG
ncbi:MAG: glycosyltransferase family 9 protein [Gemmatimonadaceae bacterium]|nr:glycosyltransferase family 9 protein [Gemmatimonadaceae bacterium]MCW5825394.1 glycosyltransferase family 9 protein [Gemmatimonadaceae bacterium]